jgi:cysteinyl-tRNA synthetase, unknown class
MNRKLCPVLFFLSSLFLSGCDKDIDPIYRQRMREFVIGISNYAKAINPDFLIIPQNGIELVTENGEADGPPASVYLDAIDANGQEDLFYGYNRDDHPTAEEDKDYLVSFLNISKDQGNVILVTDYCSSPENMDDSYAQNHAKSYISFAASHRELDNIPAYPLQPYHSNSSDVITIDQAQNFLYLINPENYSSKSEFIQDVAATNYDLVIMDLYLTEDISFNATEINQLKIKANGARRLVVSYMSIGEAEDYRYYWQSSWNNDPPSWLDGENPSWEGNFKVKYWNEGWQSVIFGNDESYLHKIIDAGFDGAYLDIIDAFEYYE